MDLDTSLPDSGTLPKVAPVVLVDQEPTEAAPQESMITEMAAPKYPYTPKAELIKSIYANNVKAGWWPEDRSILAVKLLIGSEIVEAFEEVRNNNPPVYIVQNGNKIAIEALLWESFVMTDGDKVSYQKPEGELIEIADVVIRCLDLVGHRGQQDLFDETMMKYTFDKYPRGEHIEAQLYYGCLELLTGPDYAFERLTAIVGALYDYCHFRGWDLEKAIDIKLKYNTTRPFRHGGKRY